MLVASISDVSGKVLDLHAPLPKDFKQMLAAREARGEGKYKRVFEVIHLDGLATEREVAEPGMDKADLFREAIKTFVRVQAAKRLTALGATAPEMKGIPRRPEPSTP